MTKEEILKLSRDDLIIEVYLRLVDKIDLSKISTNGLRKLLMEMNKL